MKLLRSLPFAAASAALLATFVFPVQAQVTPAETKAIAEEAFIYGLPIVMNYAVMYEYAVDTKSEPVQSTLQPDSTTCTTSRPTKTRRSSRPTATHLTRYSGWICVPSRWCISVPAVEKDRYYAVQLIDGNTYNYGYIGSRATGSEPGDYLVVGPDWKGEKPAGIKQVFTSTTPFSLALYRTQLFNPEDMPNVEKVQAGYKVQPLSAFLKQPAPPAAPKIEFLPATSEKVKENFFEYLDFALQFVPPSRKTRMIRAKLATIGIGPGKTFAWKDLSPEHRAAVMRGYEGGRRKSDKFLAERNEEHQRLERRFILWRPAISTRATG